MALVASVMIWIAIPVALVEIVVGAVAGEPPSPRVYVTQPKFVTFLAGRDRFS